MKAAGLARRRTILIGAIIVSSALAPNAVAGTARVDAIDDVVVYHAAPGEVNQVTLVRAGSVWTISDVGAPIIARAGCTRVSDHQVTCRPNIDLPAEVLAYLEDLDDTAAALNGPAYIGGGGGDDQLTACARCRVDLGGENGNDILVGNGDLSGDDIFSGKGGNDTITGGDRRNEIHGGRGSDVIDAGGGADAILPGPGNDIVRGGPGRDAVEFWDARVPVAVNLTTGRASGQGEDTLVSIADIVGSGFSDYLIGDEQGNGLNGIGGSEDVLVGRGGNDRLFAGGESTRDKAKLRGGSGDDRLVGFIGDDVLIGGPGADFLRGRAGNDKFYARDRTRDVVRGGHGGDRARVDRRRDDLMGIEAFF